MALERRSGSGAGPAAGQAEAPNLGEPLFTDPAAAELESAPLARAYASLPERQRAAAWHTVVERVDPAEAAAVLGLTEAGVAELPEMVRAALSQAYLKLYLFSLTREDCKAEAGQLGLHLDGVTRGPDERTVQRHLRGCRECRAVVIELTGLHRSLRRTVAPIFLGPGAEAYLSAVDAKAAPAGQVTGGLRWMREAPGRIRQVPRQRQAVAGGVLLLAAFTVAGLSLTLAANTAPQHRADRPFAAAITPPSRAAAAPPSSPVPAPTRPAATGWRRPLGATARPARPRPAHPRPLRPRPRLRRPRPRLRPFRHPCRLPITITITRPARPRHATRHGRSR